MIPVKLLDLPTDKTAYTHRWVTCSRHDEGYMEIWVPSLEAWTGTGCPRCKAERETGKRQPRRGQSVEEFRLELALIPARFLGKRLKDFTGKAFKEALEAVRNLTPAESLLIVGPLGSGKTSFACAVLRELLTQPWALELSPDVAGRYITTVDLMENLWNEARPKEWIDGNYSGGLADTLKQFVASRNAAKRGTIAVGGPALENLEAALGSRTLEQMRSWKQISVGKESA